MIDDLDPDALGTNIGTDAIRSIDQIETDRVDGDSALLAAMVSAIYCLARRSWSWPVLLYNAEAAYQSGLKQIQSDHFTDPVEESPWYPSTRQ